MGAILAIRRYRTFVDDAEGRSLDEYMSLFNRCICMDIVLAVIYTVLGVSSTALHQFSFQSGLSLALNASLVPVIVLWLIDAGLVFSLRGRVADSMGKPSRSTRDRDIIISRKRTIVTNASVCIAFYVLRFALEVYATYSASIFKNMIGSFVALALMCALKTLRLFAINSFGRWVSKHWDAQSAPQLDPSRIPA
mmetsp:Transcript_24184/g.43786  ORF Transcript_24184/g.43786 Transcript_24184/m.43786 type:complete len:194 (+) Transcript_24184:75-656(+)